MSPVRRTSVAAVPGRFPPAGPVDVSSYLDLATLTVDIKDSEWAVGAMKDTANPQGKSESRRSYRKVWWMRFYLPLIALVAWWYFAGTAAPAYHLTQEGVVVSGEITRTETSPRTDYMIVRFTTSEGRQVETSVAPRSCGVKQPGDTIKVRYLPSDPHTAQDACDSAHHYMSVAALLAALALTALSVQAWRLWRRYRRVGHIPAGYGP